MKVKCLFDVHDGRSLKKNKVYDARIAQMGWYIVIDESGEEYGYPPHLFEEVDEQGKKVNSSLVK